MCWSIMGYTVGLPLAGMYVVAIHIGTQVYIHMAGSAEYKTIHVY